ncbi:MAG: hydantoinase/oxoprolinase family protein [Candidatus Bathyarchaeia archaeon]
MIISAKVLAWDIGGANIKAAYAESDGRVLTRLSTASRYLPLWRVGREALEPALRELRLEVAGQEPLDSVAVTMTAELSDVYFRKREGVNHVLDCVERVHARTLILVLAYDGSLRTVSEARLKPLEVAAANWPATGWLASRFVKTCVVVDVGSTTTSIIPVVDGRVAARGRTDFEKLSCGELIYTGALRTNLAAILRRAHLRGQEARLSSELFALSADIHLALGNISEQDYTTETADGRGRSLHEALARLARLVCADDEMLTSEEIEGLAQEAYEAQLEEIRSGLEQVARDQGFSKETTPVVVAGLGRSFLAERAACLSGFRTILDLDELIGLAGAAKLAPAVGLSLMALTRLTGTELRWMRSSR